MSYLNKNFKLILIITVLIICFYRSPYIFLNGRFLAEDGSFYFSNAYSYGPLKGITQMYFGTQYFALWSNISSVIASLFPLELAPLITIYMAFLVQFYLYVFIVFGKSKFLKTKLDKIIGVLIVIVTPPMVPAVWLATNVSQVYFAIITILIFFQEEVFKCIYNKFSPLIILISSFSSLLPCFLSPFFILKYLKKRNRFNFLNCLCICLGTFFQSVLFIYIKISGLESLSDGPRYILSLEKLLNYTYNVVVKSFLGRDLTQLVFFQIEFLQNYIILFLLLIIFVFTFIKLAFYHIKNDTILKSLIFFFIIQSLIVIYAAKFEQVQGRYAVIPGILLIFCVYRVFQISKNFLKYFSITFIGLSLSIGLYEYKLNNKYPEFLICGTGCPDWKNEVKKWKKDQNYQLKIWQYPEKTMTLKKR